MMTVAEGKDEQWWRFRSAPDIPEELVTYTEALATAAEQLLQSHTFDVAMPTALAQVDNTAVKAIGHYENSFKVLLDLWEHQWMLRKWLDACAHEALDKAFPAPVPRWRRPETFW